MNDKGENMPLLKMDPRHRAQIQRAWLDFTRKRILLVFQEFLPSNKITAAVRDDRCCVGVFLLSVCPDSIWLRFQTPLF
jgi:hypothetical protein